MARLGFKISFANGTFDKAAVQTLFGHMKDAVINAGFNVLFDIPTAVDFIRMGSPAGTANDDVPHWAFEYVDQGSAGELRAYPVYGNHYLDEAARKHMYTVIWSSWVYDDLTVWFACDAAAGWWCIHGLQNSTNSASGFSIRFACAGFTSRRYPSDMNQGICARYGIWDPWGDWEQAYTIDETGVLNTQPWTGTWSPFGEGWTYNGKRHPGSPLPKMAVPQFPNRDGSSTACILGEFNEVLILTDGYTQEEMVLPGWVAMIGDDWDQPYAIPAPDSFVQL